jgi:hypothetical protein
MTKAQIKKLETVLAKLESLQNSVADSAIRERLGRGKSELLTALTMAERHR